MAMTGAERQRRYRERLAEEGPVVPVLVERIINQYGRVLALHIADQIKAAVKLREDLEKHEREERLAQRERQAQERLERMAKQERAQHTDSHLARTTLGLGRGTLTAVEINAAFRTKVKKLHPDTGGGGASDTMTALQNARDALLAQIT